LAGDVRVSVNWRDLIGGAALFAIGGFFTLQAMRLGVGTPRNMGAGYFPMLGGAFTMLCSAFVVAASFRRSGEAVERPAVRPFLAVLAAIGAFVLVMPRAGLVPAVAATALLAAFADRNSRPIPALILAAALAGGCYVLFVVGLGLPIRAWRNPF
jgi:hypothetical protein